MLLSIYSRRYIKSALKHTMGKYSWSSFWAKSQARRNHNTSSLKINNKIAQRPFHIDFEQARMHNTVELQ
jgi:hypothetical protein